ncbi:MAG: hypothetical protein ACI9R3_001504 [Verrucomicrobiales bacterium]|jgi:hypothetical protein
MGFAPCYRAALNMNVTLKLPDDLCNEVRHRAVGQSKSLSQWVADLLQREISRSHPERKSLLERLGDSATADRDFELPDRQLEKDRPVEFP